MGISPRDAQKKAVIYQRRWGTPGPTGSPMRYQKMNKAYHIAKNERA